MIIRAINSKTLGIPCPYYFTCLMLILVGKIKFKLIVKKTWDPSSLLVYLFNVDFSREIKLTFC